MLLHCREISGHQETRPSVLSAHIDGLRFYKPLTWDWKTRTEFLASVAFSDGCRKIWGWWAMLRLVPNRKTSKE
ncbi:hypothetical protein [Fervidibacter sacchari]